MNMQQDTTIPAADAKRFDEAVQLSDEKPPFIGWMPSPRQIREWCAQIRRDNDLRKMRGEGDE